LKKTITNDARREGIALEKKAIAKKMMEQGFDRQTIIAITGLSSNEIQHIL